MMNGSTGSGHGRGRENGNKKARSQIGGPDVYFSYTPRFVESKEKWGSRHERRRPQSARALRLGGPGVQGYLAVSLDPW